MNRRSFAQSMGGAAVLSAVAGAQTQHGAQKTSFYRLQSFYCRQGGQAARIDEFLSSQMRLLTQNARLVGVFTAVIGPHQPMTVLLFGFSSLAEMETADERVRGAAEYRSALDKMENGAEPPYDRAESMLLRAAEFSPEIALLAEKPKPPRIFELRIYHSPTERQLNMLHERFAGPEIGVFHRCGIYPILYGDTVIGSNTPNQVYLTPFASLAEREKAWDAFAVDPGWLKARDESIARGGQIVAETNIMLLRATPYSPIQ